MNGIVRDFVATGREVRKWFFQPTRKFGLPRECEGEKMGHEPKSPELKGRILRPPKTPPIGRKIPIWEKPEP
jgi:hypothetical protein